MVVDADTCGSSDGSSSCLPVRLIVSGSREIYSYETLLEALKLVKGKITHIVEGGARGVDHMARHWAFKHGVPCTTVEARWDEFGKAAGAIRNAEMLKYGDHLLAIPGPKSIGTWDMVRKAEKKRIPVWIYKAE